VLCHAVQCCARSYCVPPVILVPQCLIWLHPTCFDADVHKQIILAVAARHMCRAEIHCISCCSRLILTHRAHSSATFRVAFRPSLDGQYFSQTIEVVACFKAHRSFRGVSHNAVLPPWTMPVQASHTDTRISIHMQTVHFSTVPSTLYSRPKSIHVQVGSTYLSISAQLHQQVSITI